MGSESQSVQPNLQSAIWDEIRDSGAHIFATTAVVRTAHGLDAGIQVSWNCGHAPLSFRSGGRNTAFPAPSGGVILIGNPQDFPEDALRILRSAGFPGRFELVQSGKVTEIADRGGAGVPAPTILHARGDGLVFRGVTRDIARRPVLLITGTSPEAIVAAAKWVMRPELANADAPPHPLAEAPFEAVLPLPPVQRGRARETAAEAAVVVAGASECDLERLTWKPSPGRTRVEVISHGGKPKLFHVGAHAIPLTEHDLPLLLWVLIERSRKNRWSTVAALQELVDGQSNKKRLGTIKARLSQVRSLSSDPGFLESMTDPASGRPAYRLRAEIHEVARAAADTYDDEHAA